MVEDDELESHRRAEQCWSSSPRETHRHASYDRSISLALALPCKLLQPRLVSRSNADLKNRSLEDRNSFICPCSPIQRELQTRDHDAREYKVDRHWGQSSSACFVERLQQETAQPTGVKSGPKAPRREGNTVKNCESLPSQKFLFAWKRDCLLASGLCAHQPPNDIYMTQALSDRIELPVSP